MSPAPFAVFLNADDKNYVEPDISVICDKNKMNEHGCSGAPDRISEVVSPSSIQMDYMKKLFKCHTAGVREYWIVNPMNDTVVVYFFDEEEDFAQHSFDDTIKVHIYDDLEIRIADYFNER